MDLRIWYCIAFECLKVRLSFWFFFRIIYICYLIEMADIVGSQFTEPYRVLLFHIGVFMDFALVYALIN